MDEQAKHIQHKLVRVYEALEELQLHSSVTIGRAMGIEPGDITLLNEVTAAISGPRLKLQQRLRAKTAAPVAKATRSAPAKKTAVQIKERNSFYSTHKMWSLDPSLTKAQITKALGIQSKKGCDKTTVEWDFYADDKPCGIWDYRGTKWSAYGPRKVFEALGLTIVGRG